MSRTTSTLQAVICALVLFAAGVALSPALAQDEPPTGYTPVVTSATAPLYPLVANHAYITGVVKLKVRTDGTAVARVDGIDGPPMLMKAAEENIRTWKFAPHKPTSFVATFEYEITSRETVCGFSNGTTTMTLPLEVHIQAHAVSTCDPAVRVPANR